MTCARCNCERCVRSRANAHSRQPKYPWATWFDGGEHVLRSGVDFTLEIKRMRLSVYEAAYRRGYRVHVRNDGGDSIRVHAYGRKRKPLRYLSVAQQQRLACGMEAAE